MVIQFQCCSHYRMESHATRKPSEKQWLHHSEILFFSGIDIIFILNYRGKLPTEFRCKRTLPFSWKMRYNKAIGDVSMT